MRTSILECRHLVTMMIHSAFFRTPY
uniref:Uncharacterized protein n=1 Tax=Arundo donax TaxID=35708 RepID=A0A0A9C6Q6_ARUDO